MLHRMPLDLGKDESTNLKSQGITENLSGLSRDPASQDTASRSGLIGHVVLLHEIKVNMNA